MKDAAAPKSPTPAEETLPGPTAVPDPREVARKQTQECFGEIQKVLAAYRCRIIPFLKPLEMVGEGSKAIVEASFGIVPVPE